MSNSTDHKNRISPVVALDAVIYNTSMMRTAGIICLTSWTLIAGPSFCIGGLLSCECECPPSCLVCSEEDDGRAPSCPDDPCRVVMVACPRIHDGPNDAERFLPVDTLFSSVCSPYVPASCSEAVMMTHPYSLFFESPAARCMPLLV